MGGTRINNLAFAVDIGTDGQSLEETTQALNEESNRYGLNKNLEKTKTMAFGERDPIMRLSVDGNPLENENSSHMSDVKRHTI